MKYARLGASGLKVSRVALGSWLTYGNAVEETAARGCVRLAFDLGVNLFDTADVYAKGAAEEFLGGALADYRRAELVIATKVFGTMSDDVNDKGLSRKHIMESCAASLTRLRTDYIDLYQCHRHDPDTPLEEVVRAMDDLIHQGKILYWGVSEWSAEQIREVCDVADRFRIPRPISNQPLYNMLERTVEQNVIPASEELGLGQIVFSPLCQGVLTGKYQGGKIPAGSRLSNDAINKFMKRRLTDENFERIGKLGEIATELAVPMATLALAWCLRKQNVSAVIMGATHTRQIRENCAASDLELSEDVLERIEAILEPVPVVATEKTE
jgi:voltage-dependent potassium channel beta subunit